MGKAKIEKTYQVNVRLSEFQHNQLKECCELMEVNQSDFVRMAVSTQISLTYTQKMLSKLYGFMKEIDLSKATERELGEIEAYMEMLKSTLPDKEKAKDEE